MGRWICRLILWLFGWGIEGKRPAGLKQYVIVVAPHTSNWDFPLAAAARPLLGYPEAHFLGKHTLFKPPFGFFFRWLQGTPVDRSKSQNLVEQVAEKYRQNEHFGIAIAAEGTRSYSEKFKTGFYYIAVAAKVPIMFGYLNYRTRKVGIHGEPFYPSGQLETDMPKILAFFEDKIPMYPENSTVHRGKEVKGRFPYTPYKFLFKILMITLLGWLALNYDLVAYGYRQAKGQLNVIWNARPVEEFLADPAYPDSLKQRIRLVQEIRRYGFDSLGLDPVGSYTKMFDQQGEPILWVVTACERYRLVNKEWHFPVLGTVSYKGHFDRRIAEAEEAELQQAGWDTRIGEVNGWSTLGILNDPILSNMLGRSEGDLAELILHELTHGTIFMKNNLQLNENLAVFIGEEGAKQFLLSKYGADSEPYRAYLQQDQDYQVFTEFVLQFTRELEALYREIEHEAETEKARRKAEKIATFRERLAGLPFQNQRYVQYFEDFTPNNAFFMGYVRYRGKQNDFRKRYEEEFGKDLVAFLQAMKNEHPSIF